MTKKHTYHHYDDEFKKEALALITGQSYRVAEAAKTLGVSTSLIYSWKRKADAEANNASLSREEREELKRLRAENKRLKMEKDILKSLSLLRKGDEISYKLVAILRKKAFSVFQSTRLREARPISFRVHPRHFMFQSTRLRE